jgi:hypothetical protein
MQQVGFSGEGALPPKCRNFATLLYKSINARGRSVVAAIFLPPAEPLSSDFSQAH